MDIILFGMQGSGKGTLGKFLAERYSMEIFETGGELRKLANEDSELGKKVKSIIEAGDLVSNDVVMEIVENFMQNLDKNKNLLFDGIPRQKKQAESLNKILEKHNRNYTAVIIEIKEETALKRLTTRKICKECKHVYPATYTKDYCEKCNGELYTRADDNPEAIQARLKAFEEETVPTIELYKNKLKKINGEESIENVKNIAFTILDPIMTK